MKIVNIQAKCDCENPTCVNGDTFGILVMPSKDEDFSKMKELLEWFGAEFSITDMPLSPALCTSLLSDIADTVFEHQRANIVSETIKDKISQLLDQRTH